MSPRRPRLTAAVLAAGTVVPGALIASTPATAGAQSADPLGPTITQVEQFVSTAIANTDNAVGVLVFEAGCQEQNLIFELVGLLQPELGPPPCR